MMDSRMKLTFLLIFLLGFLEVCGVLVFAETPQVHLCLSNSLFLEEKAGEADFNCEQYKRYIVQSDASDVSVKILKQIRSRNSQNEIIEFSKVVVSLYRQEKYNSQIRRALIGIKELDNTCFISIVQACKTEFSNESIFLKFFDDVFVAVLKEAIIAGYKSSDEKVIVQSAHACGIFEIKKAAGYMMRLLKERVNYEADNLTEAQILRDEEFYQFMVDALGLIGRSAGASDIGLQKKILCSIFRVLLNNRKTTPGFYWARVAAAHSIRGFNMNIAFSRDDVENIMSDILTSSEERQELIDKLFLSYGRSNIKLIDAIEIIPGMKCVLVPPKTTAHMTSISGNPVMGLGWDLAAVAYSMRMDSYKLAIEEIVFAKDNSSDKERIRKILQIYNGSRYKFQVLSSCMRLILKYHRFSTRQTLLLFRSLYLISVSKDVPLQDRRCMLSLLSSCLYLLNDNPQKVVVSCVKHLALSMSSLVSNTTDEYNKIITSFKDMHGSDIRQVSDLINYIGRYMTNSPKEDDSSAKETGIVILAGGGGTKSRYEAITHMRNRPIGNICGISENADASGGTLLEKQWFLINWGIRMFSVGDPCSSCAASGLKTWQREIVDFRIPPNEFERYAGVRLVDIVFNKKMKKSDAGKWIEIDSKDSRTLAEWVLEVAKGSGEQTQAREFLKSVRDFLECFDRMVIDYSVDEIHGGYKFNVSGNALKNFILTGAVLKYGGLGANFMSEFGIQAGVEAYRKLFGGHIHPDVVNVESDIVAADFSSGLFKVGQDMISHTPVDRKYSIDSFYGLYGDRLPIRTRSLRHFREAKVILGGFTSLYTSLMVILQNKEIVDAMCENKTAAKIFFFNCVRDEETQGKTFRDLIDSLERTTGRGMADMVFNVVIINNNRKIVEDVACHLGKTYEDIVRMSFEEVSSLIDFKIKELENSGNSIELEVFKSAVILYKAFFQNNYSGMITPTEEDMRFLRDRGYIIIDDVQMMQVREEKSRVPGGGLLSVLRSDPKIEASVIDRAIDEINDRLRIERRMDSYLSQVLTTCEFVNCCA